MVERGFEIGRSGFDRTYPYGCIEQPSCQWCNFGFELACFWDGYVHSLMFILWSNFWCVEWQLSKGLDRLAVVDWIITWVWTTLGKISDNYLWFIWRFIWWLHKCSFVCSFSPSLLYSFVIRLDFRCTISYCILKLNVCWYCRILAAEVFYFESAYGSMCCFLISVFEPISSPTVLSGGACCIACLLKSH